MPESFESTARKTASVRDALTAAFTRPYFLSLLADERRFALDMGKPFCVCLIDIDQLRKFNEQSGISSGDRLLADVAEAVRGAVEGEITNLCPSSILRRHAEVKERVESLRGYL